MATKHALPLPRGSACLNCRRRKVKCDAQKPICGPCIRGPNPEQCDYDISPTNSPRPKNVQASIEKLRTSIRVIDLEINRNPSIMLGVATGSMTVINSTASSPVISSKLQEPPAFIIQVLLHTFVQNLSSVPFFLNVQRFRQRALLPLPFGSLARPHPAILNAVYLRSYFLASIKEPELKLLEPELLESALKYVEEDYWLKKESYRAVEIIQANLILAVYFFKSLDILQGHHYLSQAVDLTFRCRLHLTREHATLAAMSGNDDNTISLPDPVDPIEAGERINAFWAVVYVDKVWSCTFNLPPLLPLTDLSRKIETSWPLDMNQYERGMSVPATFTSAPIQGFLHGTVDEVHSYMSYSIKAALAYDQAFRLFNSGGKFDASLRNSSQFLALATLIPKLLILMPTRDEIVELFRSGRANEARQRISAKSLAYTAQITLHSRFAKIDITSRRVCFESACGIIEGQRILSQHSEPGCGVDPIQSLQWRIGCQALIDEILILKSGASLLVTETTKGETTIDCITQLLEQGLLAIKGMSQHCPLARYQYVQLQGWLLQL